MPNLVVLGSVGTRTGGFRSPAGIKLGVIAPSRQQFSPGALGFQRVRPIHGLRRKPLRSQNDGRSAGGHSWRRWPMH
jgi:hypothetical protein